MSNQIVRITPADGNNGLNIGSDGTDAMIGVTNNDTDLHFLSRTGGAYSKKMTINNSAVIIGTHNSNAHRLAIESRHSTVPYGQLVAGSSDQNQAVGFQFVTRDSNGDENNTMYLTSTGLGIGTSTIGSILDVVTTSNSDYPLLVRGDIDNDGGYTGIAFSYNGGSGASSYRKAGIHVQGTSGTIDPEMHFLINSDGGTANATIADAVLSLKQGGNIDANANYIVNEQGRQNHVANTMSSPYYRFDGTDDKIEDSDFGGANFSSPSGSISVWVMSHDRDNPSLQGVVTNGSTGSGRQDLSINNNRFEYSVHNGSTVSQLYHSGTITENIWYHVVVTREYDGTDTLLKMYINGVLDASSTVSSFVQDSSVNPLIIGYLNSSRYFNGQIACVRVWNHILSATEVKDDYSGASVPFKYKGASQTDLIEANDAGSGTAWTGATGTTPPDGWTSGGTDRVFTIDSSSGSGAEPALKITAGTGNAWIRQNWNTVKGKRYRAEFIYKNTAGDVAQYATDAGVAVTTDLPNSTSWSSVQTVEWTGTGSTDFMLFAKNSGDIVWFDNFSITQIGAVAEYDGSSAGEKIWGDKSGNSLDGTVTGATLENAPYDAGTEYEEGTHTATVTCGTSGTITLNSSYQTLSYVKVGRQVTVTGLLFVSSVSSPDGFFKVSLPYAIASGDQHRVSGGVSMDNTSSVNVSEFVGVGISGESFLRVYLGNNTDAASESADDIQAGTYITVGLTYFT